MRATLNEIEFSEIAFIKLAGGTVDGSTAWNTGVKNAVLRPENSDTTTIIQICTTPLMVMVASVRPQST